MTARFYLYADSTGEALLACVVEATIEDAFDEIEVVEVVDFIAQHSDNLEQRQANGSDHR